MEKSNRRAIRCFFEYMGFVLLLLIAVGGTVALFLFFSENLPVSLHTVPVSSSNASEVTVILDAGHGGEDGGAIGTVNGAEVYEKDLNLSIALLLRDLLETDGITVVMTRTEDVLLYDRNTDYEGRKKVLDLAARLHIGQSIENALFISIHMNAFPQTQYKGLQVYYSPNHSQSATLAKNIQDRVQEQLQSENHRKIKRAGSDIFLLERLECPAVLIECGFLSNAEDCAALNEQNYRQKLAFLLFCSIREAIEQQEETKNQTSSGWISLKQSNHKFLLQIIAKPLIFDTECFIIKEKMSIPA